MNTRLILDDPDRVAAFVGERIGRTRPWWGHQAIGVECDGHLIAGAVFENATDRAIEGHVAAERGTHWATYELAMAVFLFVFDQLGLDIIYGHIAASNDRSRNLAVRLGFRPVAVLEGGADHDDLIIYMLRREECRFLKESDHVPAQS